MALSRQRAYSTASTPPRRTFSLPLRPPISDAKGPENEFLNSGVGGAEHIQVLFAHSNSRIVNFTFSATTTFTGKPLPWNSPLERTIASGPLRIYKTVPHDVAFLQSGSALRPLLSRTQCWNVDGKTTFCLQLRPGNYWRIEILGVEFEQDIKCAEFRSAIRKIVAFEVTACPFIRPEHCSPVTESPDALQPAKVWKRSMARKMDEATNGVREQSSENFGDIKQAERERSEAGENTRLRLDPAILWRDIPSFDTARSWTGGTHVESPSVRQRRARYESLFAKPLADENPPDRRRSSLAGEFVFARQQWLSEHGGKAKEFEESCVLDDEKPDELVASVKHQNSPFIDDYGLPDGEFQPSERCKTPLSDGHSPTASPLAINTIQMTKIDDEYPSPSPQQWQDFTPLHTPMSSMQKLCVTPPFAAPPVLNDATISGTPSRQSTRPSTPECSVVPGQWYTPTRRATQPEIRLRRPDRGRALPAVDPVAVCTEPPEISPTLTLSSGSESEPGFAQALRTPLHLCPTQTSILDARASRPKLRRAASSLALARAADVAAATANFVVLKPSAFLVAMMFSIAARITARAITGAAYSLAERSDRGLGWDVWDDEDDYFLAPPRSERRRRRSETVERKKAWELEERVRRTTARKGSRL